MAVALPPIDETVQIPAAVKAAAARADAFYQQQPPETPPVSTPQPPEPPQSGNPAPAEAAPEPEPPAPTPPPEAPSELEQLRADLAKRERDYNALLGRNAQQRDYIAMQQTQLQQLSNPRSWAQPQPRQPLITDEERKAYGDEALSVMERKAREVLQPVADQLEQRNKQLEQELQRVKANDIYSELDRGFPEWRQVNTNEDWLAWLRLPDLYSGVVRQELLNQAFASGDATRVLAFFRGYLEDLSTQGQESPASRTEPPAKPPARKAAIPLASLAAPGRASPSPPPSASATAPTITNKDVTRFYADVTHGRYAGRENDKIAREAQIHAAVREGRVQFVK